MCPGEAPLCLAAVFSKSAVPEGNEKHDCMVPPLLAELQLLQFALLALFARWELGNLPALEPAETAQSFIPLRQGQI